MTSSQDERSAAALLPLAIDVPVCVDLDGSLIKSDTLWEGFWLALRTHPLECLTACVTLLAGRASFKRRIAELAVASPSELPYRSDLLTFLSAEVHAGRTLLLATAADERVAQSVAQHLGLFTRVISSDGATN